MSRPRDFFVGQRTGRIRAARLYSNIVSPPVMFALLGLALAWRARPGIEGLLWAAGYGLLVSLTPILFVLYLLRTGRIAELHMSDTSERHLPYLAAVICAGAMYALVVAWQGPALLRCLALFNVLELAALGLINTRSLISLHSTGITATLVIVGLVFGWGWAVLLLPVFFSVAYVRLYLKRHTPGQVIAGIALGIVSVVALLPLGCWQ